MNMGLTNKVAFIAASTRGLGLGVASSLLAEGARVFICGRDKHRLNAALQSLRGSHGKDRVAGMTGDLLNHTDISNMIRECILTYGALDLLVTNAGGPAKGTLEMQSQQEWQRGFQLCVTSIALLVSESIDYLRRSNCASILTISSVSAKQPIPGLAISNAIRPAIIGLTKSLSQEFGANGIRVNSILPGWIQTDHSDEVFEHLAMENGTSSEYEKRQIENSTCLGRMGSIEEFGRVATFLLSPAAGYVTGASVWVDGGIYQGLM